jgi:acylphosphatase
MTVCRRVYYSGDVQGVGFRYTARSVAQSHQVAGTVRNLPDGCVELLAEGEADEVEKFLDAVRRRMAGYIAREDTQDEPAHGFKDFRITHN